MKFMLLIKNKFKILFIGLAFFICNAAFYVEASPVHFIVEGYLDHVSTKLSGTFSLGDLYHLEYTVDSNAIDGYPDDPFRSIYVDAITLLTITVGDYYSATSDGQNLITLYNDHSAYADSYRISSPAESMTGDNVNGCYLYNQGGLLSFGDEGGNAFLDDSLIPQILATSILSGYMALTFYDPIWSPSFGPIGITADISSFEFYPVPVPSTFLLLFSGVVGVLGLNRNNNY